MVIHAIHGTSELSYNVFIRCQDRSWATVSLSLVSKI